MIVLGNQVALQLSIGPANNYSMFTDFVDIEDFKFMTIQENSGGPRPILTLQFKIQQEEVIPYINNGNLITIQYGVNEPSSDLLQFSIEGDQQSKEYKAGSFVTIIGAMYNPGFTESVGSNSYPDLKSYELFKKVCEEGGMKFITNVEKSNDKQTWYKTGQTNWEFLYESWDQAYRDDTTFFSFALDNNNVYFYDMKEKLKQDVDWVLSVHHIGENENSKIVNISTYEPDDSDAGQLADLAGKNELNVVYNVDSGEMGASEYKLQSYTSQGTNKLNMNTTGCQNYNYTICSGDVHSNYTTAKNQNKRNNVLFSSYKIFVPVVGQYRPFKLLDTVNLITGEKDPASEGYYFITGITRQYSNGQYQTNLLLNRESANGLRGDDLEDNAQTKKEEEEKEEKKETKSTSEEQKTTTSSSIVTNVETVNTDSYFKGLISDEEAQKNNDEAWKDYTNFWEELAEEA